MTVRILLVKGLVPDCREKQRILQGDRDPRSSLTSSTRHAALSVKIVTVPYKIFLFNKKKE